MPWVGKLIMGNVGTLRRRRGRGAARPGRGAPAAKLAAACAAAVGPLAWGGNVDWISSTSGLWSEPQRWSSFPSLPNGTDDVTISLPAFDVLVTIDGGIQDVHSIVCDERLTISAARLNIAAASQVNNTFTLGGNNANLTGAGDLTLNAGSLWNDYSIIDGTGKLIVSSTGSMNINAGSYNKLLGRRFENSGAVTATALSSNGNIDFAGITFENKAGACFTANYAVDGFYSEARSGSQFLNAGLFVKQGTAALTFDGSGQGVTFINNGTVRVEAGPLILKAGATHTGDFSVSAGASLKFQNSNTFSAGSQIRGGGDVTFNAAGTNVVSGSFNIGGVATLTGTTTTFNAGMVAGTLRATGTTNLTFNGTASATLDWSGTTVIDGAGLLTATGTSTWAGSGTISGSAALAVAAGATLTLTPGDAAKNLSRNIDNSGTIHWNGSSAAASLNLGGISLNNLAGSTFNINGDLVSLFGATGTNVFNNAGVIAKSGTGSASFTGTGTSAVVLNNTGVVNVSAGTLSFDQRVINSGTVSVSGGTVNLALGLANTGLLDVTGGAVNISGSNTTAQLGAWHNTAGQVNILGSIDNSSATLNVDATTGTLRMLAGSGLLGGAVQGGGGKQLQLVGAATLNGVTFSGSPVLRLEADQTITNGLSLAGGAALSIDHDVPITLTFASPASLGGAGQVLLTGSAGATLTMKALDGQTLTIGPGVSIHAAAHDLTLGSMDSSVTNQGTISASINGRTIRLTGMNLLNQGRIEVSNGAAVLVSGYVGDVTNSGQISVGAASSWTTPGTLTHSGQMTIDGSVSSAKLLSDGNITQNGGSHSVTGDATIGNSVAGARYDLNGGTFDIGGFATVGLGTASAVFEVAGGTMTAAKPLYVGVGGLNTSALNISSGSVTAPEMYVGFFSGAQGTVNQTGGAVNLSGGTATATTTSLTIGYSSLNSTRGTYNLSGGTLDTTGVNVGYAAGGSAFNQTGGTHTISGPQGLKLAVFSGGNGSYALSNDAQLSVAADEQIGAAGAGTFNQSGGVHNVSGAVTLGVIAGSSGNFNLSGGSLTAPAIHLLRGTFNQTGGTLNATAFNHSGGQVTGTLQNQGTYTYNSGLMTGRLLNSGTVVLNANWTAGNGLDNRANFDVAAGRTVTLNGQGLTNSGAVTVSGGTLNAAVTVNDGTFTQTGGSSSLGNVTGAGAVGVSGGTLSAGYIRQNSLAIDAAAVVTLSSNSGPAVVQSLTVSYATGAALELTNNSLIVDYDQSSPLSAIRSMIISGYNASGVKWTGAGIRSSVAAADATLALGYGEASFVKHLSGTQTATFAGQTVDATSLLVRLTKRGDANLDGKVDFADLVVVSQNYKSTGALWSSGDFNYDGKVDFADLVIVSQNYKQTYPSGGGQSFAAAWSQALSLASVPEPSAGMLLWVAGAVAMMRRRRRARD